MATVTHTVQKLLLAAPRGDEPTALRDRALLEVMYACGLRASETIGLEMGDFDLHEGFLRARGKGAVRKDGTRGDLLVTVEVAVPTDVSGKARDALEAYREATADEDPRAELFQAAKGA